MESTKKRKSDPYDSDVEEEICNEICDEYFRYTYANSHAMDFRAVEQNFREIEAKRGGLGLSPAVKERVKEKKRVISEEEGSTLSILLSNCEQIGKTTFQESEPIGKSPAEIAKEESKDGRYNCKMPWSDKEKMRRATYQSDVPEMTAHEIMYWKKQMVKLVHAEKHSPRKLGIGEQLVFDKKREDMIGLPTVKNAKIFIRDLTEDELHTQLEFDITKCAQIMGMSREALVRSINKGD